MKVTWNGTEVELDVEGNPLHATVAGLVAEHATIGDFREHLDSASPSSMIDRAKMYADGKQDGLGEAIRVFLETAGVPA